MAEKTELPKFPLLSEMLAIKGFDLQATYTNHDLAKLFGVSDRAIQERVSSGQLTARNLPGKAKFLSSDIEAFLCNSGNQGGK